MALLSAALYTTAVTAATDRWTLGNGSVRLVRARGNAAVVSLCVSRVCILITADPLCRRFRRSGLVRM